MANEKDYNYTNEYSQYLSEVEQYRGKDWKVFASNVTFDELKSMYEADLKKMDEDDTADLKSVMTTWQKLGKSLIICASNAPGERASDKSRYTYDTGKYELVVTAASGRPIRIGMPTNDYDTTYFKVVTNIEGKGERKIANDVLSINVAGIAKELSDDPNSKINQRFATIENEIKNLKLAYTNLETAHKNLRKEFENFTKYTYGNFVWRYSSANSPTYIWNGTKSQYDSVSKTDTKGAATLFTIKR